MKQRNPLAVFFLSLVTLGIYSIVWEVKTKNEMNRLGAQIPTAWLIIVPFVSIWWTWKYSEGVEKVTNKELSGVMAFVLLMLLSIIGMAIVQNEFNKVATSPAGASPVGPPVAPSNPAVGVTPPTNPTPPGSIDSTNPNQPPA